MPRYMRRSSDEHYEASLIWYENHGQLNENHCVKNVRIWSFLAHIRTKTKWFQSKCGKIRTRKIPNTDTFHAVNKSENIGRLTNLLRNLKCTKKVIGYDSVIQGYWENKIIERVKVEESEWEHPQESFLSPT